MFEIAVGDAVGPPCGNRRGAQPLTSIGHRDCEVMAGLHREKSGKLPATEDAIQDAALIQQAPTPSNRDFPNRTCHKAVSRVEVRIAATAVEVPCIHQSTASGAELFRNIVNGMAPRITRGQREASAESAVQLEI